MNDLKTEWNNNKSHYYGLSYERAVELDGNSPYPKSASGIWYFDLLTREEQLEVLKYIKLHLGESLERKKEVHIKLRQSSQTSKALNIKHHPFTEPLKLVNNYIELCRARLEIFTLKLKEE